METGQIVSGAGHVALIGWMLIGGWLSPPEELPPVMAVSTITSSELAQLQEAAAPKPTDEPVTEEAPPEVVEVVEPPPVEPPPEPVEAPPPTPDEPTPAETPAEEPPSIDAAPPVLPDVGSQVVQNEVANPTVQDVPNVSDTEVAETDNTNPSAEPVTATAPAEPDPTSAPLPETDAAAPEPSTTDIVTEGETEGAGEGGVEPPPPEQVVITAFETSPRPRPRRDRPAPEPERPTEVAATEVPEPPPEATEPTPEPPPEPSLEEQIAAAAAAAAEEAARAAAEQTSQTGGTGAAPTGPPMNSGENNDFLASVRRCWIVTPASLASRVIVTVGFQLDQNRKVVGGQVTLLNSSGGDDAAVRSAYDAARRAVLRCSNENGGFKLPSEKFAYWQNVELTFDPVGGLR